MQSIPPSLSSEIERFTRPWTTSKLPTQTTLTHIDPANYYGLVSTLKSITSAVPTMTKKIDLYHAANEAKAAQASLSVILAQNYIATATNTQELPRMTSIIWNSTMQLQELERGINLYQTDLLAIANGVFAGVFALLLATHLIMMVRKRTWYFGGCFLAGTGLEFAGYLARCLSIGDYSNRHSFLCQIISLTLAPALIMAGVYYLLAQLATVHGRRFLLLGPLWYSYIFVTCDLASLIIQAAGGGDAAIKLQQLEDTQPGTRTMVAGIAFQVFSMSLFLFFLCDFMFRVWFRASDAVRFLWGNLAALLFHTKRGAEMKRRDLDACYDGHYSGLRTGSLFGYFPLILLVSVGFIYIRCIYRLIELSEGWTGFLITHEVYIMTLDALMVFLTVAMFVPFHPGIMMGASCDAVISLNGNPPVIEANLFTDEEKSILKRSTSEKCYSFSSTSDDGSEVVYQIRHSWLRRASLYEPSPSTGTASARNSPGPSPGPASAKNTSSGLSAASPGPGPASSGPRTGFASPRTSSPKDSFDGFVAVPYTHTLPGVKSQMNSANSTPGISSLGPSRAVSRTGRFKRPSLRLPPAIHKNERDSVNPYEKYALNLRNEPLTTLGPYEHFREGCLNDPFDDDNQYDEYHNDAISQITHDEDFFDFGH